jgi:hypothetical protein
MAAENVEKYIAVTETSAIMVTNIKEYRTAKSRLAK